MKTSSQQFHMMGIVRRVRRLVFRGTLPYWERRYRRGETSGRGSYSEWAIFKAAILNAFVLQHHIRSVVDFGCGDGNQLSYSDYPHYIGFDVSPMAVDLCTRKFDKDTSKAFYVYNPTRFIAGTAVQADLGLSLDVLFHIIEDTLFALHLRHLFSAATRYVIIYSSDFSREEASRLNSLSPAHIRHRCISEYVEHAFPEWTLIEKIRSGCPYDPLTDSGSFCDFLIYKFINS